MLQKISVTGGSVERRIDNAKLAPTFLMADVELVATYKLSNLNRSKLENLIHRIFDPVRLDIEIVDRFGNPVVPREWFLVPPFVIDEAVSSALTGRPTSTSAIRSSTISPRHPWWQAPRGRAGRCRRSSPV
ncbi:MAG TPA: GIY-YIG nuclease family protein [Burkholderiales bacterium]|nr:GIY-YIG nuclease family protein [Burkholderiales bacterium]